MTFFILDPVCVKESGHNLVALKRYGSLLSEFNSNEKTIILTSKVLSENLIQNLPSGVTCDRFFSHYYPDFIFVEGGISLEKENILEMAVRELAFFFEKNMPNENDTLFYPSIDYFSIFALVDYLVKNEHKKVPKIILRFIGVMEYDNYGVGVSLESLLKRLDNLFKKRGACLRLSAESEIMAEFIKGLMPGRDVIVTPTLVNHDLLRYPSNDIFTILFPGSARRDKGFDRISSILNKLDELKVDDKYRVIVQNLSSSEVKYFGVEALNLVKNSRVILLPSSLDDREIKNIFEISHIVVAPYDKEVYKYRSSAIMAESAIYGRPIIASKGCGFSDQVELYQLGVLADSDFDFAMKIKKFMEISMESRLDYASKARKNFLSFTKKSYEKLFR